MSVYTTLQERIKAFELSDIYPVISSEFCVSNNPAATLESILSGGAKVVQMREKNMADRKFLELLKTARILTDKFNALLIVDDRVDLALASDADGVHLGQDDMPLREARKIAPELLLGTSTHNLEEVIAAQHEECSYLNIGPIFKTGTKTLSMNPLGVDLLSELARQVKCPFSVMGGIKFDHLPELKKRGAKHIAAVTAFTASDDPRREVEKWIKLFQQS